MQVLQAREVCQQKLLKGLLLTSETEEFSLSLLVVLGDLCQF